MNLTTLASLPMGAGCLSRLDPEVGKSPPKLRITVYTTKYVPSPGLARLGYKVNAQGTIERL